MAEHANLPPSAASRWIQCPASIRVAASLPSEGSNVYAAEGTAAHALGEIEARHAYDLITPRQYALQFRKWDKAAEAAGYDVVEMRTHILGYLELIAERVALYPMSNVLVEQTMDSGIPQCWGTADTVIVSPRHVEIIDLKYGAGVPVNATGNPQLRLYGCGALDTFGDVLGETEVVRVTVYQPRLDSTSTEELSVADLREWRSSILPIAQEALTTGAHFGPSETTCRWCPAAGQCRAQLEWATNRDFGEKPDLLSMDEISEALALRPSVLAWASAVEETALRLAYSEQKSIPGWKVVLSGGKRVVTDATAAIKVLVGKGFTEEEVSKTSIRGIGELETLLKGLPKIGRRNQKLEDVLGPLVGSTPGRPSLVPEGDNRAAIEPNTEAQREFK